jgi:hypothetical protein
MTTAIDLDAAGTIIVFVAPSGGTENESRHDVPTPDSIRAAHHRVAMAVDKFRLDNQQIKGEYSVFGIEQNSNGIVMVVMSQYSTPSDATLALSVVESAILGIDPPHSPSDGPSH